MYAYVGGAENLHDLRARRTLTLERLKARRTLTFERLKEQRTLTLEREGARSAGDQPGLTQRGELDMPANAGSRRAAKASRRGGVAGQAKSGPPQDRELR